MLATFELCRLLSYGTTSPDEVVSPPTRVDVLGNIGPNWFASVMGTGIVAIAGAILPVMSLGSRIQPAVWVLAAVCWWC